MISTLGKMMVTKRMRNLLTKRMRKCWILISESSVSFSQQITSQECANGPRAENPDCQCCRVHGHCSYTGTIILLVKSMITWYNIKCTRTDAPEVSKNFSNLMT
jgi:hypothetical protein